MGLSEDFKIQPIPNIPSQIQEAAEHGELVVFIGAGCSCLLGYPDWDKYSNDILSQILGENVSKKLQNQKSVLINVSDFVVQCTTDPLKKSTLDYRGDDKYGKL